MKCQWCQKNEVIQYDSYLYIAGFYSPEEQLCQYCLKSLFFPINRQNCCKGCGRSGAYQEKEYCEDCQKWIQQEGRLMVHNHALFEYNSMAKEWMSRYKFLGDCRMAKLIGKPLKMALKAYSGYYLMPLPCSQSSLQKRSFDALSYLLDESHISYIQLLKHIGSGKKQSEKSRLERLKLQQPFQIKTDAILNAKKLLLIDDVYTTGATLHKAAECLLKWDKNIKIQSLTLFR